MESNDIIKAWECCCKNNNCEGCPLDFLTFSSQCASELAIKSLDLINRQQAENKRLGKEVDLVSIQFQDLQERYEEAQAKIESLKQRNTVCEAANRCIVWQRDRRDREIEELHSQIAGLNIYKSKIKAEAYKEFAMKLKSISKFLPLTAISDSFVTVSDVDSLVKEMAGENND